MVLVLGLVISLLLAIIGDPPTALQMEAGAAALPEWLRWSRVVVAAGLYSVMASTALTFFDVADMVFEAMESQAELAKRTIRSNMTIEPYRED